MASSSFTSSLLLLALFGGLAAILQGCGGGSDTRSIECDAKCTVSLECSEGKVTFSPEGCALEKPTTEDENPTNCDAFDKYPGLTDDEKKKADAEYCKVANLKKAPEVDASSMSIECGDAKECTVNLECSGGQITFSPGEGCSGEKATTLDEEPKNCKAFDKYSSLTDEEKMKANVDYCSKVAKLTPPEVDASAMSIKCGDDDKCTADLKCSGGEITFSPKGCPLNEPTTKDQDPKNCVEFDKKKDIKSDVEKKEAYAEYCKVVMETKSVVAAFLTATMKEAPKTQDVLPKAVDKPVKATVV